MDSKKEFVEGIREKSAHSSSWDIENLQNALEILSRDLYSTNTHFVLELIQNADDNDYEDEKSAVLKFFIYPEKILVQNNEIGFTDENVEALCRIGKSTKSKSKRYIGEKGIGFKSVFKISDEPRIFSNGFNFKFKKYDEILKLGYIVPYWCEAIPDYIDKNQTNIVLPLRDDVKAELSKKFHEIEPSILLFLHKLKKIEFSFEGEIRKQMVWTRTDRKENLEISHSDGKEKWKIINSIIRVPETIIEEKRKDVEETEIIFAFPLNENSSPRFDQSQKIFAYLPVKESGFKFAVQADFLTTSSREDIDQDKQWNKWLRDCFSELFSKAVGVFKEDEILQFSYYNFIPLKKEVSTSFSLFFGSFLDDLYSQLRNSECILTESGVWVKPETVIYADAETRNLISNEEIKTKLKKEYIHSKIKISKEIRDILKIATFSFNDLRIFISDNTWTSEKNDKWFRELYLYLYARHSNPNEISILKGLPIIRLEHTSIHSRFFPLPGGKIYGFENDLGVIKKALVEDEIPENTVKIKDFLKKLGLNEANPIQIIDNHIIPDCIRENATSIEENKKSSKHIGYLNFIKDNFDEYCKTYPNPEKLKEKLQGIWLKTDRDEEIFFQKPMELYLSSKYGNDYNLESFFDTGDVDFVSDCYLYLSESDIASDIESYDKKIDELKEKLRNKSHTWLKKNKKDVKNWEELILKFKRERQEKIAHRNQQIQKEIESWKSFFLKIGVNETPHLIKKLEPLVRDPNFPFYVPSTRNNSLYYDTIIIPKIMTVSRSRDDSIEDWVIPPETEKVINSDNFEKNEKYLKILDNRWDSQYARCSKLKYKYYVYRAHKPSSLEYESSFIFHLQHLKVPTTNKKLVNSSDVFLNVDNIKAILVDSVPYLSIPLKSQELIKILRVKTEATVQNVLDYLKSLSEQKFLDQNTLDKKHVETIYSYLEDHFEGNSLLIRSFFTDCKLLYIPNSSKKFYSLHEVFWNDVSDIFKDHRISLEQHYPQFKSFFLDMVGINLKPNPKSFADLLEDLSKNQKIDEKIVFKIYSELNKHLNPEKNDSLISDDSWWSKFIEKRVFLTLRGEFRTRHEGLLINDNEDLFNLFKDQNAVSFLRLEKSKNVKYFLNSISIPLLSKSVTISLIEKENEIPNGDFNESFNSCILILLRYIYGDNDTLYEELKIAKKIDTLVKIKGYSVTNLKIQYILNGKFASNIISKDTYFDGENVFFVGDWQDNKNDIADDLRDFLNLDEKAGNFLQIILKSSDKEIAKKLKTKNIEPLPDEELKWIRSLYSPEGPTSPIPPPVAPPSPIPPLPSGGDNGPKPPSPDQGPVSGKDDPPKRPRWTPTIHAENIPIRVEKYHAQDKDSPTTGNGGGPSGGTTTGGVHKDNLSKEDKDAIGEEGEKYAVRAFLSYIKQERNPEAKVEKISDDHYRLSINGKVISEAHRLNRPGHIQEKYDIEFKEGNVTEYIEVKSTIDESKDLLHITESQWRFAREKGDSFHIVRVYNAGTENARIVIITNPCKQLDDGEINAKFDVRLYI